MQAAAALLNKIVNRPDILPYVAPGYQSIELAKFFDNPQNVMLGNQHGLLLFVHRGGGVYELHYLLTEALRGAAALKAIRIALESMFTCHGATAICGSTPRENRAARAMNRALGARPIGVSQDKAGRACIDYMLERTQWALSADLSGALAP